jgi:hypothetical protein
MCVLDITNDRGTRKFSLAVIIVGAPIAESEAAHAAWHFSFQRRAENPVLAALCGRRQHCPRQAG